jgi:hypothetical protein
VRDVRNTFGEFLVAGVGVGTLVERDAFRQAGAIDALLQRLDDRHRGVLVECDLVRKEAVDVVVELFLEREEVDLVVVEVARCPVADQVDPRVVQPAGVGSFAMADDPREAVVACRGISVRDVVAGEWAGVVEGCDATVVRTEHLVDEGGIQVRIADMRPLRAALNRELGGIVASARRICSS